jgi:hypothetical protein
MRTIKNFIKKLIQFSTTTFHEALEQICNLPYEIKPLNKKFLFFSWAMFFSINIFSQNTEKKSPLHLLIGGALEFGGDEVAKVYFTNGDDQTVKAGQGGSAFIGGQYKFPKLPALLLRSHIGIKYVTTKAENAHIRLRRFPIHLTANWMITEKIRIGAGFVTHQSIRFKADNIGKDITFNSANGPIFEIAYSHFGLTYTHMKYKDNLAVSYAANCIGLTISGIWQNNLKKYPSNKKS